MICKHCLVSISPDPRMRGRWRAAEGEWRGGTHCRDDNGQWRDNERLHEPDVVEPVATTPVVATLHCGRCGMAIRRSVGRDNAWYDVRVGIGKGTRKDRLCPDGQHAHEPGDPPTTEEVEQGDDEAPTEPAPLCKHCGQALTRAQAQGADDRWIRDDGANYSYRCSGKFQQGPLHEPESLMERLDRLTGEATEALKAKIGEDLSNMLYAKVDRPSAISALMRQEYPTNSDPQPEGQPTIGGWTFDDQGRPTAVYLQPPTND